MIHLSNLFEKYREWKILRFFLENCSSSFYVNETAQKLKVSSGSVSKFLKDLEKDGVVTKRKVGNSLPHKLNNELLIVKQLKILVLLLNLGELDLVRKLLEIDNSIVSIAVYGSHASGENDEKSDLDIIIISNKKEKFTGLIHSMEDKLKRTVSIEVYKIPDWKRLPEVNREFYQSVKENHILLYGGELI